MTDILPITRALISVSNKTNLIHFAKKLAGFNVDILSTGGTAKSLSENGITNLEISHYTGFPEMMDGRLKTLHPKIHGGILGRGAEDQDVMEKYGFKAINLVVVNLYPFQATIEKEHCEFAEAIEQIDIGGPTLLRAAAKNHAYVAVVCDPADYDLIIDEINQFSGIRYQTRRYLAQKVFQLTAFYDALISQYFAEKLSQKTLPQQLTLPLERIETLRYGENPHQEAALYANPLTRKNSLADAKLLQGKPLSYNNLADADCAYKCVQEISHTPACVIVKHASPCGAGYASSVLSAYEQAYLTDPVSAFGGIIAFNALVDAKTADKILSQQFCELVIAPEFSVEALNFFNKKPNIRILKIHSINKSELALKSISGGVLIQTSDTQVDDAKNFKVVSRLTPTASMMRDLIFAWQIVKWVKSNAIVYAKNGATVGIGAGQMSRVFSAEIALIKAQQANLTIAGSVMASDAFFPFRDSIDAAAKQGISAIIQPGGSIRDAEVIAAADEHQIAMVFTAVRHFYH